VTKFRCTSTSCVNHGPSGCVLKRVTVDQDGYCHNRNKPCRACGGTGKVGYTRYVFNNPVSATKKCKECKGAA